MLKSGLIEPEFGDILGVSFDARQESDYELIPYIDYDLAIKRYGDAKRFVDRVETYLESMKRDEWGFSSIALPINKWTVSRE